MSRGPRPGSHKALLRLPWGEWIEQISREEGPEWAAVVDRLGNQPDPLDKCARCGAEFEQVGDRPAKFCSSECRMEATAERKRVTSSALPDGHVMPGVHVESWR